LRSRCPEAFCRRRTQGEDTITPAFDQDRAEAFAGRMSDVLNHGTLALLMSIGHRVGLYDVMADLPASTSGEIASAAELQERYVREWLGAMTTDRRVRRDGFHVLVAA
jgi:hypothetical protein